MRKVAFVASLITGVIVALSGSSAHAQAENKVTIQSGDTLSKIAKAHDTNYIRLFNANEKIENPDIIFAGDTIRIPSPDEVLPERPLPGSKPAVASQPVQAQGSAAPAPRQITRQRTTVPAAPAPAISNAGVWDRLAACESGGNWSINTGNGYYGGLQFSLPSWRGVGGAGYPHQASKSEQIRRAEMLQARQGWGAWPACSAQLGLR